ncbi:DUF308 domain-containing protein [Peribacillus asahii]|uniref:DUF308 domain-containing protein n=1 Tax=Peribacillus asahii TaxID=228899 RepID=UPI00207ADB58|nr:DUF308 domain-containing protein [Peribacillus asahii]USK58819.1 DUF308 domain-containing protein [Peribacillus asahii]
MEENRYTSVDDEVSLTPKPMDSTSTSTSTSQVHQTVGDDRSKGEYGEAVKNHYLEETSAEVAAPISNRGQATNSKRYDDSAYGIGFGGTLVGTLALIASILSLFMMPILLGIVGIVAGFIARSKGAKSLGAWAIGIGAVSIIVGIFILPFF